MRRLSILICGFFLIFGAAEAQVRSAFIFPMLDNDDTFNMSIKLDLFLNSIDYHPIESDSMYVLWVAVASQDNRYYGAVNIYFINNNLDDLKKAVGELTSIGDYTATNIDSLNKKVNAFARELVPLKMKRIPVTTITAEVQSFIKLERTLEKRIAEELHNHQQQ